MRRILLRVMLFVSLGALTTIAVAWTCALWPRGQQWEGTLKGITHRDQPGWALKGYEGPGFQWVEGWSIFDYQRFLGPRLMKEFVEYPTLQPIVIPPRRAL